MTVPSRIIPVDDLSRRFNPNSEVLNSISQLILNGPYFNSKYTNEFEIQFANFIGVKNCISVSSGTSALELSIKALELPNSSIILTTANAGGYSAIAAKNSGFRIKYIDIDQFGLIDVDQLEQNAEGVSAIIVTHLYGQVCDMDALLNFAFRRGIKVIEDCAQAVGSTFDFSRVGTLGDIAAFSFYPTKNLGGVGDSGAVCTNSEILRNRIRQLREYGWADRYFSTYPGGGNHRNDEIQSLVLLNQLDTLNMKNAIRKEIWNRYFDICQNAGVSMLGSKDDFFIPHLAVLKVSSREAFISHMNSSNVAVAIHYPLPDYLQPALTWGEKPDLPNTSEHCNQVVTIPLFPEMMEEEIKQVEESLMSYFGMLND